MSGIYAACAVAVGVLGILWATFFSGRLRENARRMRAEEAAEVARHLAKAKEHEAEIYSRPRGTKSDILDRLRQPDA